ncbi:MAG: S9 family peptidase, partial [Paludibacteraceae bacterium]|nr:S9 family peptidase [Paludibacteraceae bacterium]
MTTMATKAQEKRAFEISDLYRIESVSSFSISPDGERIAMAVAKKNLEKGESKTTIYITDRKGDNKTAVTTLDWCGEVRWSKDGKELYFCTSDKKAKGKEKKGDYSSQGQLFRASAKKGAKIKAVTNFSMGVNGAVLSKDERFVLFSSKIYPEAGADNELNYKYNKKATSGPVQAHVADSLLYRHWTSWNDGKREHIILFDTKKGTYTDLTPGDYDSPVFMLGGGNGFGISPDGKEVCFSSNRSKHPEANTNSDVFITDINGKKLVNITASNEGWDGDAQYSPDGKYIAYKQQLTPGYESDMINLVVYNRENGEKKVLTEALDNWVDGYKWAADSKSIYFSAEAPGHRRLYNVTIDGKMTQLTDEVTVGAFDVDRSGNIVFTATTVGKPSALYALNANEKEATQITHFNDKLEKEVDIRSAEIMWVKGAEGADIEVFIVKPHGFDPKKKYPLVLNVHGGPQQQWTNSFRGDWQVYPGKGYIVAFCNPHGSTGYGQDFTRAISGDWGGKPFEDLMAVCDTLEKLPFVDKDRMGAMGWSFGGYMMNWFQAKTKRFKCLASMMGVYNLKSMWGATEELWFPNFDLEGRPWDSEQYVKFSP